MKLWEKDIKLNESIERFTVGRITDEHFGEMARKSQLYKSIGKYHLLDADAVLKILNMSL